MCNYHSLDLHEAYLFAFGFSHWFRAPSGEQLLGNPSLCGSSVLQLNFLVSVCVNQQLTMSFIQLIVDSVFPQVQDLKRGKKISEHNLDILPLLYFLEQARYPKCTFNLSFLLIFISSSASFLGLLMFVHHTAAAAALSSLF